MPITVQPNLTPINRIEAAYNGRIAPLSGLDISCNLKDPTYLGKFVQRELRNTYIAWLMSTGNEMVKPGDNVYWTETGYNFSNLDYIGTGLVTRVGNVFTLNPAAVVLDTDNIDNCAYTAADVAFGFGLKQEILIIDSTGKEEYGIVDAIASDRKSATILSKDNAAWAIDTTNLDMIGLGKSLDNCEAPTCVGFRYKDPAYSNSFKVDADCFTYCEEDTYGKTNYEMIHDEMGGSTYHQDRQLDEVQKRMWLNMDRDIFLAKRTVAGSAADTANKFSVGTDGIIEQVKDRGYGWTGTIDTIADLETIDDIQRRNGAPNDYIIHANGAQYKKLQNMITLGTQIEYDPFVYNGDTMRHLGFKGIDVYGRNYYFQRWDILDQERGSANLEKAYNFIITPQGENKIVYADGTSENVGYVTLVWGGDPSNPTKMKRYDTDLDSGKWKVEYKNKYAVVVAQAKHFVLGKPSF